MERVPASKPLSRLELHQRLRQWFVTTSDAQIGSEDVQDRTSWVCVEYGSDVFRLHADTKREAVEEYLRLVQQYGEEIQWTVVPNQRGNENAVAYGPHQVRITSFYLYLV